jgi:hypothetical protein
MFIISEDFDIYRLSTKEVTPAGFELGGSGRNISSLYSTIHVTLYYRQLLSIYTRTYTFDFQLIPKKLRHAQVSPYPRSHFISGV